MFPALTQHKMTVTGWITSFVIKNSCPDARKLGTLNEQSKEGNEKGFVLLAFTYVLFSQRPREDQKTQKDPKRSMWVFFEENQLLSLSQIKRFQLLPPVVVPGSFSLSWTWSQPNPNLTQCLPFLIAWTWSQGFLCESPLNWIVQQKLLHGRFNTNPLTALILAFKN